MKIRDVFARNLRRSRNARGLSQEALAHEADMDRTYISSLERGVYSASIDTVAKLAKVLGIEPDELLKRSFVRLEEKVARRLHMTASTGFCTDCAPAATQNFYLAVLNFFRMVTLPTRSKSSAG
jgi:transcriptional regulator with XRE-family HTH domain